MTIPIDYVTLRVIWWILLGVLLIGFAVMDGFDLGIGMLLHRVARTDEERRIVLNTLGPIWEGNQIWLILGAGAIFAAWPAIYAVSFSGFYFAMLLVLFALILRPVGFKYRSKIPSARWRVVCDAGIFLAGLVPTFIFGVAIGNVLQGVPFYFDDTLRVFYTGSLFELLNPFALLCGFVSITMLMMHGSMFLNIKTTGMLQQRAVKYGCVNAVLMMLLFAAAGVWVTYHLPGYHVAGTILFDGPSNPLHKTVQVETGTWIQNYLAYHWLMLFPLLGFLGALAAILLAKCQLAKSAWLASAISVTSVIVTVGVSMFPFILPSSSHPDMSLLVWDASSSHKTLFIMFIAAIIFIPLIMMYTSWVYYVLRGKVTNEEIQNNSNSY